MTRPATGYERADHDRDLRKHEPRPGDDDLALPEFLRVPQSERAAAWKGKKLTRQGSNFKAKPSKVEEAATRQLRKELEQQEKDKREARFARLRELRARK